MGDASVRMAAAIKQIGELRRQGELARLPEGEQRALTATLREAAKAGAGLTEEATGGGLAPSLALGIFRRDRWRCKRCGGSENLGLHHKGHLENPSPRLARLGHANVPSNLVTICTACHDAIHQQDQQGGA